MKYLKLLLFYIFVFFIESIIITVSLHLINLSYSNPDINPNIYMSLLAHLILYMYFKCIIELPLSMLIIIGLTYKLQITRKAIILSRIAPALFIFSYLVAFALSASRGIDLFSLSPVLYLASIYITYTIYKKHIITIITWIESHAASQAS